MEDFSNLLNSFTDDIADILDGAGDSLYNIIEFVDNEVDLGIDLSSQQKLILKLCYGLELTENEESILEYWKACGKTSNVQHNIEPNIVAIEAGRRCIREDSLILTDKGLLKLNELSANQTPNSISKANFDVFQHDKLAKTESVYTLGYADTIKLTTEDGYQIEGTPEHKLKVLYEEKRSRQTWKHIDDIKEGDFLVLRKNANQFGYGDFGITSIYAHFIGAYTVCGMSSWLNAQMYKNRRIAFLFDLKIAQQFMDLYNNDIPIISWSKGVQCEGMFRNYRISRPCKTTMTVFTHYKHFKRLIEFAINPIKTTLDYLSTAEVPKVIRQADKKTVVGYIQGVFDAKGYVEDDTIVLQAYSYELVRQLQVLLLNLGIESKIGWKFTKDFYDSLSCYTLTISKHESLYNYLATVYSRIPIKRKQLDNLGITYLKDIVIKNEEYIFQKVIRKTHSKATCMDLTVPENSYYIANGIVSHNSGKTTLASIIAAYEFYCLCKIKNPQTFYGISKSTPINILVIATTAKQAKGAVFKTIVGIVKNSKYFSNLVAKGLVFIGKEEITYDEKQIYITSGNSKSGGQVGLTLKCLIMDEVARFKSETGDNNALTLWSNLGISCSPFRDKAKRVAISSAWQEDDAIYQLIEKVKNSNSAITFSGASWDLNPVVASRDNPLIVSEYVTDPVKAACEFEGIRPPTQDALYLPEQVDRAFRGKSCIQVRTTTNTGLLSLLIEHIESYQGRNTVVHIDPAIKKDGYALAFGHSQEEDNTLLFYIDGLLLWQPEKNIDVSFTNVADVIRQINSFRPIQYLTADHYNSVETIQRLKQDGINSSVIHFSNSYQLKIYDHLRKILHEDRLIIPSDSQWSPLALRELKQIQLINNTKVDHPEKGSKDLADCITSVVYKLSEKYLASYSTAITSNTTETVQKKRTTKHRNDVLFSIKNSRKPWTRKHL